MLYCPIKSHRIFMTSNCIVIPCSVPINCPAVIFLPFMPCCLYKESTSSELWTPVQSLPLIHLPLLPVYLLQTTITFHTFNPLLQQTGELDNLTDSLGKSLEFVLCRSPRCLQHLCDVSFLLLVREPRFLTEGKLADVLFTPCSWGFPTKRSQAPSTSFWRRCRGG